MQSWAWLCTRGDSRTPSSFSSSKRDMKKLIVVVGIAALAASGVRAAHAEIERVERTVKLEPGGTLHLKSFSGRVNITASDANQVVIHAVRHATRDRLDRIK